MKKLFTTIALATTCMFANAQKGQFTLSLGTTSNPMAQAYKSNELTPDKTSIPIHFEAGYYLGNKIQLSLAFNSSNGTSKDVLKIDGTDYKLSFTEGKASSFMLRFNYFYVNKKKFQLGSGLGMGIVNTKATAEITPSPSTPISVSLDKSGFGIHLNVLEARYFFTDHIGAYANLGLKDQGYWGVGVIGKF